MGLECSVRQLEPDAASEIDKHIVGGSCKNLILDYPMIRAIGCLIDAAGSCWKSVASIPYNELEKVSAVETFQNGFGGFKVGREIVSFRSPRKCPALESFP